MTVIVQQYEQGLETYAAGINRSNLPRARQSPQQLRGTTSTLGPMGTITRLTTDFQTKCAAGIAELIPA